MASGTVRKVITAEVWKKLEPLVKQSIPIQMKGAVMRRKVKFQVKCAWFRGRQEIAALPWIGSAAGGTHCWKTVFTSLSSRARRQILTSSIFPLNQFGQTVPRVPSVATVVGLTASSVPIALSERVVTSAPS